ncbi:hypothetical protein SAMD00019534_109300 [Acytostelium subglobosum LB1]|uniref:hypothetical protein n=1 Tax=Acytostelium subglobosum LB1 TaxID=1410327 RepID=UPI00064523AD|nr:hypothetical protein SAMD00019534_109300 [Acytostelium subglobosum LB1]GAM27754.1 hypothetical protein SAMD00019534_109300 [Acytostelium subglobosum LB1]|eukprot:XP_012749413.1 hypothetical protein SAMD00019534_109300 [Acytostelium subglobosum LB1]
MSNLPVAYDVKTGVTEEMYKYMIQHSVHLHPAQKDLYEFTKNHDRAIMMTALDQCSLFTFFVKILNAKNTIDVGVFTGLSSLTVALALPEDGKVIGCDVSTEYTDHARKYWKQAGVDHKIDLRIRPATETLQELINQGKEGTFDFVFIDADKPNYDAYYELSLKLIRKGGIIAFDNVFFHGDVLKPTEPQAQAIDTLNKKLLTDKRVVITTLAIADGLTLVTKA